MSERESQRRSERPQEQPEDLSDETTAGQGAREDLTDDVDAVLDEIDAVLETNAAEFVASFVQKGGQ
ncbi:MAG TPA: ubiquitin-like protein Pup [Actinobacteria bacterium]|nr:ubiquitin-like protein Pup [Actinomycetota bacterium]